MWLGPATKHSHPRVHSRVFCQDSSMLDVSHGVFCVCMKAFWGCLSHTHTQDDPCHHSLACMLTITPSSGRSLTGRSLRCSMLWSVFSQLLCGDSGGGWYRILATRKKMVPKTWNRGGIKMWKRSKYDKFAQLIQSYWHTVGQWNVKKLAIA